MPKTEKAKVTMPMGVRLDGEEKVPTFAAGAQAFTTDGFILIYGKAAERITDAGVGVEIDHSNGTFKKVEVGDADAVSLYSIQKNYYGWVKGVIATKSATK